MELTSKSISYEKINLISNKFDAVDVYFECITTCSLDDGDCVNRCVQQLRDTQA